VKVFSWNVNGIRACINKGFYEKINDMDPDILCLQETKISLEQITDEMKNVRGYKSVWNPAKRKGYSGTAVYIKDNIDFEYKNGFGVEEYDVEGRVIELELKDFILYNVYFPNGQKDDERLQYKLSFYKDFLHYVLETSRTKNKGFIITGDFNTAHTAIDLKNPKANEKYSGFLPIEREWVDKYLESGLIDIFRKLHPNEPDHYTWWTYRFNARTNNVGWRIDYFLVTENLTERISDVKNFTEVLGSDHCPISLEII